MTKQVSKCHGADVEEQYFGKLGDGTWDWDYYCSQCHKPCGVTDLPKAREVEEEDEG